MVPDVKTPEGQLAGFSSTSAVSVLVCIRSGSGPLYPVYCFIGSLVGLVCSGVLMGLPDHLAAVTWSQFTESRFRVCLTNRDRTMLVRTPRSR